MTTKQKLTHRLAANNETKEKMMETYTITKKDLDKDNYYIGKQDLSAFDGNIHSDKHLGYVKFKTPLRARGRILFDTGEGIEAGSGIEVGLGIKTGEGIKVGEGIKTGEAANNEMMEKVLTQEIKNKYIERAQAHYDADEIVQGVYWENGKGCCIGCLAHANNDAHVELEKQTNTPEWLHRVADAIFEGLPIEDAKKFPVPYMQAMPVGLSALDFEKKVKAPFLTMALKSTLDTFDHEKYPEVKNAVDQSIALWQRDDIGSDKFKDAAAEAAWVADAAAWAARAVTWAARAVTWAAETADAAAEAAWEEGAPGRAVGAAVFAAAWAAGAVSDDADAAAEATWGKTCQYFRDELLRIMKEANQ